MDKEMKQAGIDESMLLGALQKAGQLSFKDILYLSIDSGGKMYIQPLSGKYVIYTMPNINGSW
jgi:hypothetical protein